MAENELKLASAAERAQILRDFKNIAVVGLSDNPYRPSYGVSAYMLEHDYNIIPVNPTLSEVFGRKCYPSLKEIAEPVEIVNVFRKPSEILPIVEDAIAIGAKVLWLQLDVINEEAARRAQAAGLQVVMDKCIKVEHAHLVAE